MKTAADPAAVRTALEAKLAAMERRQEAVESLLTHLQHELAQMHAVLLAHTAELGELRLRVERFEGKLERLEEPPEDRDPRAEKPPHY